jgi:hypothetical protein
MKKIIQNPMLQLCCVFVALLLVACEKDDMGAPVITGVRNYAPSPDDSVLQSLQPGQWVILTGHHLSGATQIVINGVSTDFNNSLFSDTYAVVQVPAVIPFPIIPAEQQNTIQYVTTGGSTIFAFDVSTPAPTITSISNENANAGDVVRINGTNLFLLNKLSFAGTEITAYTLSNDGTFVTFTLPEISGTGPVVVANKSGEYTTPYSVNDPNDLLCNFDDVNTLSWGPSTDNSGTAFPGNKGYYAILKNDGLTNGNFSWWEGGRSINTNGVEWLPPTAGDSLRGPVSDFAVKFEINIPDEWSGTTIILAKDYGWNYVARYEPWSLGNGKIAPFSTDGKWMTVTIPLSEFRTKPNGGKDGTGVPAGSLKALLGDSASGSFHVFTVNDSGAASPALNIAVDNIRVVQIN